MGSYKALRHGTANMDVLVALGTSAAYFYSVIAFVLHMFVDGFELVMYFETSVLLITFILLGRYTTLLFFFNGSA